MFDAQDMGYLGGQGGGHRSSRASKAKPSPEKQIHEQTAVIGKVAGRERGNLSLWLQILSA